MKDVVIEMIQEASTGLVNLVQSMDLVQYYDFLIGVAICIVAGWIIGSDRERVDKPAGIKTHTLVLLGSMLFTVLSEGYPSDTSPSRIAANIVTGVGFLGAGIILKNERHVANLTTAAGVWVSAAIGMAIGFKMYFMAIVMTIVVAIGLHVIPHPEKKE